MGGILCQQELTDEQKRLKAIRDMAYAIVKCDVSKVQTLAKTVDPSTHSTLIV